MSDDDKLRLIEAALEARQRAYAPYSNFLVGAALLSGSGKLYCGCNIENASYGLTCCAERVAIFSSRVAGETEIVALAVASSGGVSPCGACRQVISEFANELPILMVDADRPDVIRESTIDELLPLRFGPDGLRS